MTQTLGWVGAWTSHKANQFLTGGDRSLLKTAVGSEAVDLS
jgi:hypothetical protein